MSAEAVERVIVPPTRDLGDGFQVRRALPAAECRLIGPFVFLDQFGPTRFEAGAGLDVRPHPHIGLATVTYLFEGEIVHRDSLGSQQVIRPGEVNWMIAGAGIVHSERTARATRQGASSLAGIQSWVALPRREEQRAPSFAHHGAAELPLIERAGRRIRVIAGTLLGEHAPIATLSPMGYADAALEAGAELELADEYAQRAVYVVAGSLEAGGRRFESSRLLVLPAGETIRFRAQSPSRLMLIAGEPLEEPRFVWWNFVASSRERIEQAKADWREARFARVPGDELEYIPLPRESGGIDRAAPRETPEGNVL